MAFNWRYYQETGQVGGTTSLQYVDSFNGDDANSGAYNAPKQSIQGAIDAGASTVTLILSGYFNEGDFVGYTSSADVYAEGYVIIDGAGFDNCFTNKQFNRLFSFGFFHFIDYFIGLNWSSGIPIKNNCIFENINISTAFSHGKYIKCIFVNITFSGSTTNFIGCDNCVFINTNMNRVRGNSIIRNCYFDEDSILDANNANPTYLNHNFYQGTAGNGQKIRVGGVWYENVEALQAATSWEADSLPSTIDPLLNPDGLSISENSPLRNVGWNKRAIGCFQIAHITEADTPAVWTLDNLIENNGKFVLDGASVGTATSSLIEVFSRPRNILSIQAPDFVINPFTGETIGRLASARTPYTVSIEIQYSTNGTTTNGTWLRVPIGAQPYHDTVNDVGNDHEDFDITNAVPIEATHMMYRVTLRNNEIPLT